VDGALTRADAAAVRAAIAAALAPAAAASGLGAITLRDEQRTAVAAVRAALARYRGALLADPTGAGKTFVALAVARGADDPLVIAPAVLRPTWFAAAHRAGVAVRFASLESLSRGRAPRVGDLLVIDEAHHLRHPHTARYRAAAALVARAPVLLLSATPIHNRDRDLATLLALFLGAAARALDPAVRRAVVVQAAGAAGGVAPRVLATRRLRPPADDDLLAAIAALPPAGAAWPLVTVALIRAWASSDAALAAALRRRAWRTAARADACDRGLALDARDLSLWTIGEDAQQLALPGLVGMPAAVVTHAADALRRHADACAALGARVRRTAHTDAARARLLRAVLRRHAPIPVVAFSHAAETVLALFHHLRRVPGVAALTARGARVAGGALTVGDALARFAPVAHGRAAVPAAERIALLLATDLASEGVNLQDAGAVVHLDLPWTVARLAQRVGRVARPGGAVDAVAVYAVAPPASAAAALAIEARLRTKWRAACAVRSPDPPLWPFDDPPSAERVAAHPPLAALARAWRGSARAGCAAVAAPSACALAVVTSGDTVRLAAWDGDAVREDEGAIAEVAAHLGGADVAGGDAVIAEARSAIAATLAARGARVLAGLDPVLSARRATWRALDHAVRAAPRHERARVAEEAARTRRVGAAPVPVALEPSLGEGSALRAATSVPQPAERITALLVGVPDAGR
jgi:hypothetical protein